jgi:hypothetical protein
MVYKDGVAYLQAGTYSEETRALAFIQIVLMMCYTGGGIVFDSDPYDEYVETINKLGANMTTLKTAEEKYSRMQSKEKANGSSSRDGLTPKLVKGAHIDLAAG